jgi:hypothetical protein
MRAKPIAVLLCATLAACVGKPRSETSDLSLAAKPGKAVVVVGIGQPNREQGRLSTRLDDNNVSLEFARIRNGRAEDMLALPERARGEIGSSPISYRVLLVDPGTYALARVVANTELADPMTSPTARNMARSPFVVHELLSDTAYQFKVAEGEIAYVGDYTVDPSFKPTRITVGHTPTRALEALRKHPKLGTDMVDRTPLAPTATGLPPKSMRDTNDPLRRMPLPAGCPPTCQ